MNYEVMCGPSAAALKVVLDAGETITAEGGAMLTMSASINVETTTQAKASRGGILKAMKRMLGGENFFMNHFTSRVDGAEVMLSPTMSGDIVMTEMDGSEDIVVQSGSWMASGTGIDIDTKFGGLGKALFSGEAMFWLRMSGVGPLFLSSFGAVYKKEIDGDFIVDTGHIVAYTSGLNFKATKAKGSWLTAILGGEGLVCKFSGRGSVWIQSHNPGSFGSSLGPKLKTR
jgi:uncharacterized protein (TIGR00266 family)